MGASDLGISEMLEVAMDCCRSEMSNQQPSGLIQPTKELHPAYEARILGSNLRVWDVSSRSAMMRLGKSGDGGDLTAGQQ